MIIIGRVFELVEVQKVKRIKGTPVISMIVNFACLEYRSDVSLTAELSLIVYEKEPIIVLDSKTFTFTKRSRRQALQYVKHYLEGWDGVEFDRSPVPERRRRD